MEEAWNLLKSSSFRITITRLCKLDSQNLGITRIQSAVNNGKFKTDCNFVIIFVKTNGDTGKTLR